MDWRHDAACLDEDPNLFFPVGNTGPALRQIEAARAVCCRCPVSDSCLEFAETHRLDSGVWGGLSEEERSGAQRRAQKAAARARAKVKKQAAA